MKFSEIFAFRTPNFRLFSPFLVILKVHDERNRMTFVSAKAAVKFSRYSGRAESASPTS